MEYLLLYDVSVKYDGENLGAYMLSQNGGIMEYERIDPFAFQELSGVLSREDFIKSINDFKKEVKQNFCKYAVNVRNWAIDTEIFREEGNSLRNTLNLLDKIEEALKESHDLETT